MIGPLVKPERSLDKLFELNAVLPMNLNSLIVMVPGIVPGDISEAGGGGVRGCRKLLGGGRGGLIRGRGSEGNSGRGGGIMIGGGASGRVSDCVSLGPGNKSAASDAPEGSGLPVWARTKSA